MSERHTLSAEVTGNANSVSKEKQTPSIKIAFRVEDENPKTVYADLWLTDKTFESTMKTLEEVFGWQGDKISELNEPILKGCKAELVCEWEEFSGQNGQEWKEKVVFINRPGGGAGIKKMDEATVSTIAAKLDGVLARHRASRPRASAPPKRTSANNDGMPF